MLLKVSPSARVVSCKLTVPALIKRPSAKVNVPPVEEMVVPAVMVGAPKIVRSAVCVARVPGGDGSLYQM